MFLFIFLKGNCANSNYPYSGKGDVRKLFGIII